jgi:hypothetical protein
MAEEGKVTIPGEDFFKSLGKLEALAGQEPAEGDDMNKAQLFHTPSSSERTAWPGGAKKDIGNNWDDSIGKDGTDYHPARKAIAEKALKGLPLAPEELAILKGDIEMSISKGEGAETDAPHQGQEATLTNHTGGVGEGRHVTLAKADNDDDDEKEKWEKEKRFGKSLEAMAQESPTVQQGIEVSTFLAEFAKAFGSKMDQIEKSVHDQVTFGVNHILEQVGQYMDGRFDEQGEFNKSLADAIVNIGHGVAGNIEQTIEQGEQPVGPPRSQLQVLPGGQQVLQKSFDGAPGGEQLSKSQITEAMTDLVIKGELNALEVSKFDMTGELRPDIQERVVKHIQAAGNE